KLPTYYMSIYMMSVVVRKNLESLRNKFFIGSDLDEKKMTWVKWKRCLASKNHGGLNFGSSFGLNIGLLFKWIWRFLSRPSDLWALVIQNIYGLCGGITKLEMGRLLDCGMIFGGYPREGDESSQFDSLQAAIGNVSLSVHSYCVFLWRLNLNELPSRVNLDRKGIDVGAILCPICHGDVEQVNHTFFNYKMAKDLWALLANLWELDIPMCANILEWCV
nr:RNA-directed DNA polymerase, eukaryota [Tanacetum cinerariifolium]